MAVYIHGTRININLEAVADIQEIFIEEDAIVVYRHIPPEWEGLAEDVVCFFL